VTRKRKKERKNREKEGSRGQRRRERERKSKSDFETMVSHALAVCFNEALAVFFSFCYNALIPGFLLGLMKEPNGTKGEREEKGKKKIIWRFEIAGRKEGKLEDLVVVRESKKEEGNLCFRAGTARFKLLFFFLLSFHFPFLFFSFFYSFTLFFLFFSFCSLPSLISPLFFSCSSL